MYYSVYKIGQIVTKDRFYNQRLAVAGWVHNPVLVNKILKGEYDTIYPLHIELCSTYLCNFDCKWCSCRKSRFDKSNRKHSLDYLELCKIIDECSKKFIGIQWTGGEPLMNIATIDGIEYGTELGINQCLFTNGSLLLENVCVRLLKSNLRFIRISLNCASIECHSSFHGNISFDLSKRTMDNVSTLCRVKYALSTKVQIGISVVVDSNNLFDVSNTLSFIRGVASDYPCTIDYIIIRAVNDDFDGIVSKKNLNFNEQYKNIIETIDLDEFREMGISIIFPNEVELHYAKGCEALGCSVFSEIAPDGTMFLCSDKYGNRDYKIGNVLEQSVQTIWDSDKRKNVQIEHMDCFSSGSCPRFSRGWYFNLIFSQVEELRLNGEIEIVNRWIRSLQELVPPINHSFFI